jgi:2-isopropylmalate synthase
MDDSGKEQTAADLWAVFRGEYGIDDDPAARSNAPSITAQPDGSVHLRGSVRLGDRELPLDAGGAGPIDAFVNALNRHLAVGVRVLDYHEHAIASGADARAAAYLELRVGDAVTLFGVGIDANIVSASLKAIVSGLQRALRRGELAFKAAELA